MAYIEGKATGKIVILPNLDKSEVPKMTLELISWFKAKRVEVLLLTEDAGRLGLDALGAGLDEILTSDAVVALGGDGTILRAVRMLKGAEIPVIGVNMGRVGFLSEVEPDELYPAMERLLSGDYIVDERMMLECKVRAGDCENTYLALNEIAIERGHHQRMLEMDVYINDIMFSKYTANGLIFATPTGSTAYSFSAGGPVVSPENELILLAPVNPHSLFGRTMALSANDTARVELAKDLEVIVGVDGCLEFCAIFDSVEIRRADSKAQLIKLKEQSFYTLFKIKLRVWDSWLR
ncbi:MAG: NAD(+)/NADH kinase [Actinobacteria bacterium]|nr:NAD(+)/NADH kinase [Actinomycetota bacterium]